MLLVQILPRKIIFVHILQAAWICIGTFRLQLVFSFPVAETKKATVNRSFYYVPPLYFFTSSKRLLSDSARKRQPVSSMSCISYPAVIDPRVYCSLWPVSRFTWEFVLWKVVALFKACKPAAWRLELRLAKFLYFCRCELLYNRIIDWNAFFYFLLDPFLYSFIHFRILWSTVTLLRTGKSSFVLLSHKSLLFQSVTCVFPQLNVSTSLRIPGNPLLFSYSSTIWKRFSKGNSFLAYSFVLSFAMNQCCLK